MYIKTNEAAATLTVGVDALRNERLQVSSKPRAMRVIAVVGGNAINEAAVDIYIEDFYVGRFWDTLNGAVQIRSDVDLIPVGPHFVPAGSKITAIIATAPTVSPLIIQIL